MLNECLDDFDTIAKAAECHKPQIHVILSFLRNPTAQNSTFANPTSRPSNQSLQKSCMLSNDILKFN